MDIIKRQKAIADKMRLQREADAKKKAELIAANPKPPLSPTGPNPDVSQGIGFGTRRNVPLLKLTGGRKRKSKSKKTLRRSKK